MYQVAEKFIVTDWLLVVSTFIVALMFSWFVEGIILMRIDRKK